MEIQSPFRGILVSKGRRTSKSHIVTLRGVRYKGKIYFSRHRPDSDWFKNVLFDPKVEIIIGEQKFSGTAKIVSDEKLNQKISELKYPGEDRAKEKRVAIEITLDE